jgi:hypothetical protein
LILEYFLFTIHYSKKLVLEASVLVELEDLGGVGKTVLDVATAQDDDGDINVVLVPDGTQTGTRRLGDPGFEAHKAAFEKFVRVFPKLVSYLTFSILNRDPT